MKAVVSSKPALGCEDFTYECALGSSAYAWLDEDRMASVNGPGVNVSYEYDADGRRVKEVSGGATKQYLIDRLLPYGQVVVETNGSGNLNAEYVYGLERVSQERGGVKSYYLADGQGSVRQLTDSVGNVTDTYDYTAFGEALASTGTTVNEFRYAGEQADPNSGFYYLRARWMDPRMGRFIGVDPYGGDPQSPISLHRYLYANQSPINGKDPSGRITLVELTVAVNILGSFASGWQIGSGLGEISEGNVSSGLLDVGLGLMGTGVVSVSSKAVLAAGARLFKYRNEYINLVKGMEATISTMRLAGTSAEKIMIWAVEERNAIKVLMRARMEANSITMTEKIVAKAANKFAELRNLFKYHNRIGPSAEKLIQAADGDAEFVIEQAMRTSDDITRFFANPYGIIP